MLRRSCSRFVWCNWGNLNCGPHEHFHTNPCRQCPGFRYTSCSRAHMALPGIEFGRIGLWGHGSRAGRPAGLLRTPRAGFQGLPLREGLRVGRPRRYMVGALNRPEVKIQNPLGCVDTTPLARPGGNFGQSPVFRCAAGGHPCAGAAVLGAAAGAAP